MRFVVVGRHVGVEVVRLADQLGLTELSPATLMSELRADGPTPRTDQPAIPALVRTVVSEALSVSRAPDRWILQGFPPTLDDARWLSVVLERQRTPLTAALIADPARDDDGAHAAIIAFYASLALPLGGFLA